MSHETALEKDARCKFSRGQEMSAVILDGEIDEMGKAMTKVEKVKTFVHPEDYDLERGDTVMIKLIDVGKNYAEAITISKG